MASNVSAQTRGLSAADWTRLKRLRGARSYLTSVLANTDIISPVIPQAVYNPALLIPRHGCVGRIRRPASDWISYVGSQTADFVLQTDTGVNGKQLTSTRLCDCSKAVLNTKVVGCKKCSVYVHKTMN